MYRDATYQGVLGRHIYHRGYLPGCTRGAYRGIYTPREARKRE